MMRVRPAFIRPVDFILDNSDSTTVSLTTACPRVASLTTVPYNGDPHDGIPNDGISWGRILDDCSLTTTIRAEARIDKQSARISNPGHAPATMMGRELLRRHMMKQGFIPT
jgi:hypothetical protein